MLLSPLERTVAEKGPCTQRAIQRKREIREVWVIGKLWKDCQDFHWRYIKKKKNYENFQDPLLATFEYVI